MDFMKYVKVVHEEKEVNLYRGIEVHVKEQEWQRIFRDVDGMVNGIITKHLPSRTGWIINWNEAGATVQFTDGKKGRYSWQDVFVPTEVE